MHAEIGGLRGEMTAGFAGLRVEIAGTNDRIDTVMERVTAILLALCVALVGVLAAAVAF